MNINKRQTQILNIIRNAENQEIQGSIRMQQIVFLICFRKKQLLNYKFIRWDHGPFSTQLNLDLQILETQKLITITGDNTVIYKSSKPGNPWNEKDHTTRTILEENQKKQINKLITDVYQTADIYSYCRGETINIPTNN